MALGALSAVAQLRATQADYHRVLSDQADSRQKYESLVSEPAGLGLSLRLECRLDDAVHGQGIRGMVGYAPETFMAGGPNDLRISDHPEDTKLVDDSVAASAQRNQPFSVEIPTAPQGRILSLGVREGLRIRTPTASRFTSTVSFSTSQRAS
jgi:hypothetical protein